MNRRDAALIAHLDAIEGRTSDRFNLIDQRFNHVEQLLLKIIERLDYVVEQLAGVKVEAATHTHGGEE